MRCRCPMSAGAVREVRVVEEQARLLLQRIPVEMVDAPGVEGARPADEAVDLVALVQQQLGEVRAVLAGDPSDQGPGGPFGHARLQLRGRPRSRPRTPPRGRGRPPPRCSLRRMQVRPPRAGSEVRSCEACAARPGALQAPRREPRCPAPDRSISVADAPPSGTAATIGRPAGNRR